MSEILVELQDWLGNDRQIAEAAWTRGYDKSKRDTKTDEQVSILVRRLAQEGHSVPFESVVLRFWIRMPIFVDRQHMPHRIGPHSGLSDRYRTMPTDYYDIPENVDEILLKIENQHPNIFPTIETHNKTWNMFDAYYESCEIAINNYKLSINKLKYYEKQNIITNEEFKRVREVLQGQLPLSCFTERTTIFNLRSFSNYIRFRIKASARRFS